MINGYETKELMEAQIAGLIRERDQYLAVGDTAAAEACNESLRAFGHKAKAPSKSATRRSSAKPKPKSAPKPKAAKPADKK